MCCIVSLTVVVSAGSPLARVHNDKPSFSSSTGGNAEGMAAQVEIDALHMLCAIRGTPMAKRYYDIVEEVTGPADRPAW
jgi:hypothetical protein